MNIETQLAHALGYEWITGGECVCVRPIERDADGIAQVTLHPDESEFVTMRAGYDKLTGIASALLAENARLREALTELANVAASINDNNRAGIEPEAEDWSALHTATQEARAALKGGGL